MSTKNNFLILLIIFSFIIPSVSAIRPHYIYDNANVVTSEYEGYINLYGELLDKATTAEVVIITLSTLPSGKTVDETKLYYLNEALLDGVKGVGKAGKDNGVVILLVMDSHDWAIETGYGVEAQLTDAMCGVIGRDVMTPQFQKGDFGLGLYNGMRAISRKLGYDNSITMAITTVDTSTPVIVDPIPSAITDIIFSTVLLMIPITLLGSILKMYFENKAEEKRMAELMERSRIADENNRKYLKEQERKQEERRLADEERRKTTFFCPHCNKQTIGRMNDEQQSEITDNGFFWLLTLGSILCLTCNNKTNTSETKKQLESVLDRQIRAKNEEIQRKKREIREAEERKQREEEEEAERIRRRKREAESESRRRDDSYSRRSSSSSGSSGSSFGGGHSGGGGASGKWD
jgi:uncharacterized protein